MFCCVWILVLAVSAALFRIGFSEGSIIAPQLSVWPGVVLPNNSMVYVSYVVTNMAFVRYFPITCELLGGNATFKQWYQPDGSPVPTTNSSFGDFGQRPYATGVELYSGYMGNDLAYYYSRQQGVHRCVITDEKGATSQLFVGLYLFTYTPARGVPTIMGGVQYKLLTAPAIHPPVFQLNCTSTGSPATFVQWTINGSATNFVSYQILKNAPSSTYENILIVTGKVFGLFACNVTTWTAPDFFRLSSAQSAYASLLVGRIESSYSPSTSTIAGTINNIPLLATLLIFGMQLAAIHA